jgi:hypothetical protein
MHLDFHEGDGMVGFRPMKKAELANHEARRQRIATGNAADQLDRVVNQIIRALRSGRAAELPGLGTIEPGKRWIFHPEKRKALIKDVAKP